MPTQEAWSQWVQDSLWVGISQGESFSGGGLGGEDDRTTES